MTEGQVSFWRRNRWLKWIAGGLVTSVIVAAGAAVLLLHRVEPYLRARIVEGLQQHFHARVELDSFHISLVDGLRAEGLGLRIWPPIQATDTSISEQGEPLIRLAEFRFHAPLRFDPGKPIHISLVQLKGLEIRLPPKSRFKSLNPSAGGPQRKSGAMLVNFRIDNIECTGANLLMETSKPGKLPMDFAIAHLKLTGIATGEAMGFEAELTNPRPVGKIYAKGSLGPWLVADPGESPVAGTYRFEHADLANFKEIAGILNSAGRYQGTLRNLVVDGETETPDFRLTHFGNALPLHTRFHALVDGTNGDTWLDPVNATLGRSHFWVQGQIVRATAKGEDGTLHGIGHNIDLTVNIDQGRIENFLHLASRSATPLLTGTVTAKAALHIPPGKVPVHERLRLNGTFVLDQAQFTSPKIQNRIAELSLRGRGRTKDLKTADPTSIQSHMEGSFRMGGGTIALPALEYTVPGARIQLKGAYGLEGGTLDFAGTATMDAPVSKIVGGWKGFLLKPADRFFRKDGAGTKVPIHIEGTREAPKFGTDFGRKKSAAQSEEKR